MADQEFLASFGVEIDETGLLRLQEALINNRALADELAGAFDRAREAMEAFFQSLAETAMPTLDFNPNSMNGENQTGLNMPFNLDLTKADKELSAFNKEAGKQLKLSADASGVVSAGQGALNQLKGMFSSTSLSVKANVQLTGVSNLSNLNSLTNNLQVTAPNLNYLMKAATGGRFAGRTQIEIAEDGDPEYVIPVKKENIALPLLRQLIGEMSDSAKETLRAGMGDGNTFSSAEPIGRESGSLLSGLRETLASASAEAAPVVTQNNQQSVQAPVNINVTASGSNPEAIGRSVYDVAEHYLLRTLKTVL